MSNASTPQRVEGGDFTVDELQMELAKRIADDGFKAIEIITRGVPETDIEQAELDWAQGFCHHLSNEQGPSGDVVWRAIVGANQAIILAHQAAKSHVLIISERVLRGTEAEVAA